MLKASQKLGIPLSYCGVKIDEDDGREICHCCQPPHFRPVPTEPWCVCDKYGNHYGFTPLNNVFVCCSEAHKGYAINPKESGCCGEGEYPIGGFIYGAPNGVHDVCCPNPQYGINLNYDGYWNVDHADCCPKGKLKRIYGTDQYQCCG